jgi:hypothetical protein
MKLIDANQKNIMTSPWLLGISLSILIWNAQKYGFIDCQKILL